MSPHPVDRASVNRENAQHSTGPRTAEGKTIVSANALKHGIYAHAALLPHENAEDFHAAYETLRVIHNPTGDAEMAVVRGLHECEWRLARSRRTELYLYTIGMREVGSVYDSEPESRDRDGLAQTAGYRANFRLFEQLRRHENHLLKEHKDLASRFDYLRNKAESEAFKALLKARVVQAGAQRTGFVPSSAPAPTPPPSTPKAATPEAAAAPQIPPDMPQFTGPMRAIKRDQWLRQHGINPKTLKD